MDVVISRRNLGFLFVFDSTGFRENVAGFYYALRNGKKRRGWIKVLYLLDTRTQICVSEVVTRGPSGDAWGLAKVEEKSALRALG